MKRKALFLLLPVILAFGNSWSQPVSLRLVGKTNIMFNSVLAVHDRGVLYSIDVNAALYKTILATGEHTRLGNVVYKNTRFFFGVNNHLYIIENDGSMTQIDLVTGTWNVVSVIGTWLKVDRVVVVGNNFYTVQNGVLYLHPTLSDRLRKQIGEAEFFDLGLTDYTDSTLHSVIGGNLYQINPVTGKWTKIGPGKVWRSCKGFAVMNNKIYSVETPASLYVTSLPDGTKKLLDDTQFKNARYIFAENGKLYEITLEGDLYEIIVGSN